MKKGWQTKRLGEVCEIIKGRKPMLKATPSNGDLPYLVAKVMRGSAEAEYASVKDRNSVTVETTETIIICDGSNSGEVFTGFRGVLSSTMGKIAKKAEIDDDYLRAFLASTFEVFNGAKTGAAIPHLDKEAMYQLQFPFPPLAEQQRIVGLLDEAFEVLATAKANAEKNLQNARALFESHLQSVFTQRGPGWVEKSLGDVCETTQGVQIPKNLHFKSPGENRRRYLYISDFDHDENLKYVDDIFPKKRVTENDLIVVNTGATAGKIFRGIDGVLSNNLFKVTLNQAIDGDFLYYIVTSSLFKEHQKKIVKGTANPHMGHENFKSTPANIPPLDVQLETVTKLDELAEETQRLARLYERKLAALAALKKSLLHQAFTGLL